MSESDLTFKMLSEKYNNKILTECRNNIEEKIRTKEKEEMIETNKACNLMHDFISNSMKKFKSTKSSNIDYIKLDYPVNPLKCDRITQFISKAESTLPVKFEFITPSGGYGYGWCSSISYDNSINKFKCEIIRHVLHDYNND